MKGRLILLNVRNVSKLSNKMKRFLQISKSQFGFKYKTNMSQTLSNRRHCLFLGTFTIYQIKTSDAEQKIFLKKTYFIDNSIFKSAM